MNKSTLRKETEIWVDGAMLHSYTGEKVPKGLKGLVFGRLRGVEVKVFWINEEGRRLDAKPTTEA